MCQLDKSKTAPYTSSHKHQKTSRVCAVCGSHNHMTSKLSIKSRLSRVATFPFRCLVTNSLSIRTLSSTSMISKSPFFSFFFPQKDRLYQYNMSDTWKQKTTTKQITKKKKIWMRQRQRRYKIRRSYIPHPTYIHLLHYSSTLLHY